MQLVILLNRSKFISQFSMEICKGGSEVNLITMNYWVYRLLLIFYELFTSRTYRTCFSLFWSYMILSEHYLFHKTRQNCTLIEIDTMLITQLPTLNFACGQLSHEWETTKTTIIAIMISDFGRTMGHTILYTGLSFWTLWCIK